MSILGSKLLNHGIGLGSELDDIIRSYEVQSGNTISTGDLCEFINGKVMKTSYQTSVSNQPQVSSAAVNHVTACKLDANHVVASYTDYSGNICWAAVLTISGSTISVGTLTQITTVGATNPSLCKLDDTHVVLIYDIASSGYPYSVVLTISGTTITKGVAVYLAIVGAADTSICSIDSTHVFAAYQISSSSLLMGAILTISGTDISVGTLIQLSPNTISYNISLCPIDLNRILLSFNMVSANGGCVSKVITIKSDYSVFLGTEVKVSPATTTIAVEACLMAKDTLIVVYYDNNSAKGMASILKINITTISASVPIIAVNLCTECIRVVSISPTKAYCIYKDATNSPYALKGIVLTISGNLLYASSTPVQFTSYQVDAINGCFISNSAIVVVARHLTGSNPCCARVIDSIDDVLGTTVVTHALNPNVVALTGGTAGSTIRCIAKGVAKGLSGLKPTQVYYCDDSGNLVYYYSKIRIGFALSDTELLIDKAYWER